MKGVICSINSEAAVIDITHEIPRFGIREAAVALGTYYHFFPVGTIHVCVVDPGVGSGRRSVVVSAKGYQFVGPDNGIFSVIYRDRGCEVRQIASGEYMLKENSSTFQGRDIFSPVAAWLSKGISVAEIGPCIHDYTSFDLPEPRVSVDSVEGEILFVDHFGNAVSNVSEKDLVKIGFPGVSCSGKIKDILVPFRRYYAEGEGDRLFAVVDSSGLVEICVFQGSASEKYGLVPGERITFFTD